MGSPCFMRSSGKQQPVSVKAWTYENLERKFISDGNGMTGECTKIRFAMEKLLELEKVDDSNNDNDDNNNNNNRD
eukprot:13062992-Ditylum_brightwellii.AAC.1